MSAFTTDPKKFKYKRTRRGVDATCPIQKGGVTVATLYDDASAIVAKVEFTDPAVRAEFLAEARLAGHIMPSEAFAISEYARKMTMDAEEQ